MTTDKTFLEMYYDLLNMFKNVKKHSHTKTGIKDAHYKNWKVKSKTSTHLQKDCTIYTQNDKNI